MPGRDHILSSAFGPSLDMLGLKKIAPRRWIDGSHPPCRRLFEFLPTKGNGILVSWGFSLDFVPHISGGKLRWHRSDKSALLDVWICPSKLNEDCMYLSPRRFAETIAPQALRLASEHWNQCSSYDAMLDIIKRIRRNKSNYYPYAMSTQMPLAFAFLSAKLGNYAAGVREVQKHTKELLYVREWEKLQRVIHEATPVAKSR